MGRKTYGELGVAYEVVERQRDWISIFVHTDDRGMRDYLSSFVEGEKEPHELLVRYDAWHRSSNSAQRWLAEVLSDYRRFFESDRVKFIL